MAPLYYEEGTILAYFLGGEHQVETRAYEQRIRKKEMEKNSGALDKGVGILETMIGFTSLRHKVVSSNISNSDTPGYTAKDLPFESVFGGEQIHLETTNSQHIKSASLEDPQTLIRDTDTLYWGDKNNVEIDTEVAKMTENALLAQASIKLISTKIQMYRNAITRRQ